MVTDMAVEQAKDYKAHTVTFDAKTEAGFSVMDNAEFELAEQFALHTRKHCFVTGKAGTGKTTLLKRLVERTQKNVVVVAPTGVAAVNAGGVTIHSMFGLPLTCFVPSDDIVDLNIATNRSRLLGERLRLTREKLHVLQEMYDRVSLQMEHINATAEK